MDKYTLQRIELLHPTVRCEVTNIINECDKALTGRAKVRVTQGLRTNQEQDGFYAQGRTKPGKIVTNAKGGQSIHNYGFAVDICLIIDGKEASWDVKTDWDGDQKSDWLEVVEIFSKHGWDWGGNWKKFKDMPHFEKKGHDWKNLIAKKKDKAGYVILALVLSFMVSSCGSRKVNRSSTVENEKSKTEVLIQSKVEDSSIQKNNIESYFSAITENISDETESYIVPIDNNKPITKTETINGNTKTTIWNNAAVNERTKKDNNKKTEHSEYSDTSIIATGKIQEINVDANQEQETNSKTEAKKVDAERGFSFWWFLLLIVPIGVYIYRKI